LVNAQDREKREDHSAMKNREGKVTLGAIQPSKPAELGSEKAKKPHLGQNGGKAFGVVWGANKTCVGGVLLPLRKVAFV